MSQVTLWSRPAWNADRWVREFFGPATSQEWFAPAPGGFSPAAEVVKDGDDAVVRLEIPGVDADKDVTVELENGRLVIHGERRDERAEQSAERTVREVRYGSFRRSFALPEHITGEDVTASYDAGVLNIRVAGAHRKPEVPGARRIAIESK
ncbi:heat-shock protein Hsp20 [Mycobacterium sp. MS1601]|uniref:Hsp20/alpha crystallin family protein n=1 Tax=Mycobacterium sp. MS1601 TaxID=1936029 RepID=UPI00097953F3|nr:Hsp20/alpha crystallin family protein [Mycobacterium sp. MS1601]AQA03586.1 heat-shock protein Hsp20 [Mycobacterium sp. MS1601]